MVLAHTKYPGMIWGWERDGKPSKQQPECRDPALKGKSVTMWTQVPAVLIARKWFQDYFISSDTIWVVLRVIYLFGIWRTFKVPLPFQRNW